MRHVGAGVNSARLPCYSNQLFLILERRDLNLRSDSDSNVLNIVWLHHVIYLNLELSMSLIIIRLSLGTCPFSWRRLWLHPICIIAETPLRSVSAKIVNLHTNLKRTHWWQIEWQHFDLCIELELFSHKTRPQCMIIWAFELFKFFVVEPRPKCRRGSIVLSMPSPRVPALARFLPTWKI